MILPPVANTPQQPDVQQMLEPREKMSNDKHGTKKITYPVSLGHNVVMVVHRHLNTF